MRSGPGEIMVLLGESQGPVALSLVVLPGASNEAVLREHGIRLPYNR